MNDRQIIAGISVTTIVGLLIAIPYALHLIRPNPELDISDKPAAVTPQAKNTTPTSSPAYLALQSKYSATTDDEFVVAIANKYGLSEMDLRNAMNEVNHSVVENKPKDRFEAMERALALMRERAILAEARGKNMFYVPDRRPPYKANEISYHDSREAAIEALADQFDRSPAWIERNMGSSNYLDSIHSSLVKAMLLE